MVVMAGASRRLAHRAPADGGTMSAGAAASVFLFILLAPFASGQECQYEYLKQPPSALMPPCSPYEGVATTRVQCVVAVPSAEANVTEIRWFHNNQQITGSFPATTMLNFSVEAAVGRTMISSTLSFDGLTFNDTFQGEYFCQIIVRGDDSFPSSNSLLLSGEDDSTININPCLNFIAVDDNVKCVFIATLPLPSTTVGLETSSDTPSQAVSPPVTTPGVASTAASTAAAAESEGSPLQVWVYVLVAIAAVFGMIIVVLAILCVGLCLKKNKTEDTYKQKGVEIQQFTSNSMISNGLYQRKDEGGVTSGTHFSSHSQISDYNTLNERDYEVINMGEDKHDQDYHHLQRPSLPGGRNFNFTPPKEGQGFQSMSTLTSQMGNAMMNHDVGMQPGRMGPVGLFLGKSASVGPEEHVYRELEQTMPSSAGPLLAHPVNDIYRSPTDSESPDSAQLFARGVASTMPAVESRAFAFNTHESLYSPNSESSMPSKMQPGGLENVPETGQMFNKPVNPTAFPVHKYELIPNKTTEYETPITTRTKTVTSPSTLTTSMSSDARPRTNSGARYETELPASAQNTLDSQYSKLTRPSEASIVLSSANAMYSELSQEARRESVESTHVNRDVFSQSTAKVSKREPQTRRFSDRSDKGYSVTSHVSSSGGMANRESSVSAADSLASYIALLQESAGEEAPVNMDGLLFSEGETHPRGVEDMRPQQNGRQKNASLHSGGGNGYQQRAWSEERRESVPNGMKLSGFSSSVNDDHSFPGYNQGMQTAAPKMHRELRSNGIDLRLGDYARSKTMV